MIGNWATIATFLVPAEDAVSGMYFARFIIPEDSPMSTTRTWRADASRVTDDKQHAMLGRDPKLPPAGADSKHAYGAAGKNKLRIALRFVYSSRPHTYANTPPK